MTTPDHYAVLQVTPEASPEVIKASYRALIRRAHPDGGGEDVELVQQLNAARSVLLDSTARAAYDEQLGATRTKQATPGPDVPPDPEPAWGREESWGETPGGGEQSAAPFEPDMPPPEYRPPGGAPSAPPGPSMPMPPRPGYGSAATGYGMPGRGAPGFPGAERPSGRRLLVERVAGAIWLLLTLATPILMTIDQGELSSAVVPFVVIILVSLFVARLRVRSARLPVRYVLWVGLAVLAVLASPTWISKAVYIVWTATYLTAVELRRRRCIR